MKAGKNVRRIIPRDLLDRPQRNKDGSIVTIAVPRGKLYPYSSVRQRIRQGMQETNIPPLLLLEAAQ